MPNKKSAEKALRQNATRRFRNRAQKSALRNVLKRCRDAAQADDPQATEAALRLATKKLDQAAAKHLIHKNTAARTKSRLAKLVSQSQSTEG